MTARNCFLVLATLLSAAMLISSPKVSGQSAADSARDANTSILRYLKPGQRVWHTPYEGGLIRLEVVGQQLLAAAAAQGKKVEDWPTVMEVTNEYVVLEWDTEGRTATQIVPKATILELWINNETK